MAFSHDMFTFLIICFIIPQLMIAQAQSQKRRPEGVDCENDRDCLNGQICDNEERRIGRCYEQRNVAFKGNCKRNAGKFLLFSLYNNKSF